MTNKRLKVKLYPTHKQKQVLEDHFNAYRYCYNLCLEYKIRLYKDHGINISGYDMQKELFKLRREVEFLNKCKAECVRQSALDVHETFIKFFGGNGYPKFKSRKNEQSFHANQSVSCVDGRVKFYGQKIKYKTSNSNSDILENTKIKRITFKKDSCGDYWASCLIEVSEEEKLPTIEKSVGIDLGLKALITTSDGEFIPNNKYLISKKYQLRRLQRRFSKTKKGGKNREKLRKKVAKLHRKVTRQREHYYHQITNKLIRENQTIVIESLKIKNMVKNRKLSRTISDVSWRSLTTMLEYKCEWYGRKLIKVGTFFPSSKTCSNCGNVKEELKLSERTYECNKCSVSLDRDVNAAINIRNEGLKIPGLPVEDA